MRRFILLLLVSTAGFAANWSGILVDSGCYASEQRNTNKDPSTTDRDMNMEIRRCAPKAATSEFALVLPDWQSLMLDAAGNAKAAELIRKDSNPTPLEVTVKGDLSGNTIKVATISLQTSRAQR